MSCVPGMKCWENTDNPEKDCHSKIVYAEFPCGCQDYTINSTSVIYTGGTLSSINTAYGDNLTLILSRINDAITSAGVPSTRTLTINGTPYDLSADRTWAVGDILSTGSYADPAWITSLAYSKITGAPSVSYTASNGITLVGNDFRLGGNFSSGVTFDGLSLYGLDIQNMYNININNFVDLSIVGNSIELETNVGGISLFSTGNLSIIPNNNTGTIGQFLQTDGTGNVSWASVSAAPAGSNTQIQFNSLGVFGASPNLTTNGSNIVVNGTTLDNSALTPFSDFTLQSPNIIGSNAGQLTLSGGVVASGVGNGGNLNLYAGSGSGGGIDGIITFATTTTNNTIEQATFTSGGVGVFQINGVSSSATVGESFILNAGSPTSGNSNGGDISLQAGIKFGSGRQGNINIGTSLNNLGFFGTTAVNQQSGIGATLTNLVTSGGSANTIADFTSLTVYATDAGTIRNNIYQLAEKLRKIEAALKTYGIIIN